MIAPEWARWLIAAAMAVVVGYHVVHGARRWRRARRTVPLSDLWHATMGAGMGLMALGAVGHGPSWWLLVFAVGVAVLAGRALDRYVVGGIAEAARDLRRVVAAAAMCWMLAAPSSMMAAPPAASAAPAASGAAPGDGSGGGSAGGSAGGSVPAAGAHEHSMSGMGAPGAGTASGADPTVLLLLVRGVTVLLLVAVLVLAVRSAWRVLRRWLPDRPGAFGALCSPALGPASRQGCQLAMHVTAALMLAAMM